MPSPDSRTRVGDTRRYVLGTVQLGMPYGVANRSGRPKGREAAQMVETAWEEGVRFFDTAQAYGESESVLGACFRRLGDDGRPEGPHVVTKLHPELDPLDAKAVLVSVDRSLERLGVPTLYGLMIHREAWLDCLGGGLGDLARSLKERGKIRHFGVSTYSMERAEQAVDTEGIDLIQLPLNVLDQRAAVSGLLSRAERCGKQVFLRSLYLQGLLLVPPDELAPAMSFARPALERFHAFVQGAGVSPQLAAVGFVLRRAPRAFCVLGAETVEQVRESIRTFRAALDVDLPDMSSLAVPEARIINPSLWP